MKRRTGPLGAIGHDLRTPLASLRIRAENVEPEEERERMIATIEEMTATLEDILTLARSAVRASSLSATDLVARSPGQSPRNIASSDSAVTFAADGPHID